jgi:hypothetical protein
VTEAAGITKADGAGLGVATGDYNGDGWLDLYVANDATPNQLWMNQKNGTYVDEGVLAGVAFSGAGSPEGSMGIASGDYDRDGDEDLFVTNIIGETFALYTNDGRGGFEDTDTDVLVTNNTGPVRLLIDQIGADASWLQVRLDNGSANRLGLGALVHVERPGAPSAIWRVRTDGSYLSASDPTLHFGLGEWRGPVTVRVDWPGGSSEQWTIPTVDQRIVLVRGRGTAAPRP